MPKKHLFHFSVGDSDRGPIGMCCSISAATRDAALARLKRLMPEECDVPLIRLDQKRDALQPGEYMRVYLNRHAIYTMDIDDIDEVN